MSAPPSEVLWSKHSPDLGEAVLDCGLDPSEPSAQSEPSGPFELCCCRWPPSEPWCCTQQPRWPEVSSAWCRRWPLSGPCSCTAGGPAVRGCRTRRPRCAACRAPGAGWGVGGRAGPGLAWSCCLPLHCCCSSSCSVRTGRSGPAVAACCSTRRPRTRSTSSSWTRGAAWWSLRPEAEAGPSPPAGEGVSRTDLGSHGDSWARS